jgi:hypothetical protein
VALGIVVLLETFVFKRLTPLVPGLLELMVYFSYRRSRLVRPVTSRRLRPPSLIKGGEMQQRGWKKYGIGAGAMLVLVAVIVLASGGGSAVARSRACS